MYKILAKPIRVKQIKFKTKEQRTETWKRLKRHTTPDDIGKFRLFAKEYDTLYRGNISSKKFKITSRYFKDKGSSTIVGNLDFNGNLVITMKPPLGVILLRFWIWIPLGGIAYQLLSNMKIDLEHLSLFVLIIGIPTLIIIVMQRWLTNDRLYSEWKMLEDVLNHG